MLEQTHQFFSGFQNPVSQRITNGSHVCNKCFLLNTFLAHQRTSRYIAQHAIISESFSSLPNKRRGGEERGSASTPKSVYTRPVCTVYTLSRWTIFVRSGDASLATHVPPQFCRRHRGSCHFRCAPCLVHRYREIYFFFFLQGNQVEIVFGFHSDCSLSLFLETMVSLKFIELYYSLGSFLDNFANFY